MSVLASHAPGDVDVQPTVRPINASDNLACSIAGFPNPRTAHLSLTSPISDHTLPLGSCHHLQGLSRPRVSRCLHQPYATLITYKAARFLITDQPSDSNIEHFIRECRLHRVHKLVRVCEPEYDKSRLEAAGIEVVDLEYGDGSSPPEDIIERWFYLILDGFQHNPHSCIAVHCKSGLGRWVSYLISFC
ncbi:unnamed protein product [Protopolystoma xenopodis]|uniref:Tyrosine specific protein phosphatases domain-containing protein n=1 Tax=Protopolystoma xenopodis TaxID=117903 RepID=A0A448WCE7_9PLAT|nr:unnamed protein product [Protopolystoma xenopodis]